MRTCALRLLLLAMGLVACLALAQTFQGPERKQILASGGAWTNVQLAAFSIERGAQHPSVIRLKGNVEIKMKSLKLFADEAEFNEGNGEIEARGVVRILPYPAVDAAPGSN